MQVEVKFTADDEDDGFSGSTTVIREGILDLHGLGQAFTDSTRAVGFGYVENVAFEKEDGTMVFGSY